MPEYVLPPKTPEGKTIIYYQPSKKPSVYGVRVIDPKTGKPGQSLFMDELTKGKSPSEYEFRAITDPKIEASRRRREEKGYEREMAAKRAEVEARKPTPTITPESKVRYYLTKEGTKLYWKGEPPAHIKEKIISEISEVEYKAKEPESIIREKEHLVREIDPKTGEPVTEWKPRKALKGLVEIREAPPTPEEAVERIPLGISPIRRPTVELKAIKTPISPEAIAKEEAKAEKARLMGEVRAAPPIPWYEKPTALAERLEYKAKGIKKVPYIAGAVGLGAVGYTIGLGRMVLHPIRTVKGLGYAITHPFETGAIFKRRLVTRPATVIGEVGAMIAVPFAIKGVVKGVRKITPKKYIPEKLVEARARITYPKEGKPIEAWELKVERGKPIKAIRPPKVKPVRVAFKGEIFVEKRPTVAGIYERAGIAKISLPKKAKVPIVEMIKREMRLKKISVGKPVKLPKAPTFPKAKPYREFIRVKGFEKLQVRPTELISIEPPKILKYPYVTAKKIKVEPTIRKGAKIVPRYLKTEVPKEVIPKAYEELIFAPTKRPYVRKPKVIKPVKIEKPSIPKPTLKPYKPKGYVRVIEKKKRFDIGELRMKEITRKGWLGIDLSIPKARQIAIQRVKEIIKPVTAKVRKVKPIIRYQRVFTPTEKVLGRIAKERYPYVPPPVFEKPVTLPLAPRLVSPEAILAKELVRPTIRIERITPSIKEKISIRRVISRKEIIKLVIGIERITPSIKARIPIRGIVPIRRVIPVKEPKMIPVPELIEVPPITIPTVTPVVAVEKISVPKKEVITPLVPVVVPKYKPPRVPRYPRLIPPREFATPFIPFIPPRLYFFERIRKAKKIRPREFEYAPSLPAIGQWWIEVGKRPSPRRVITPVSPRPIFVPTKQWRKRLKETGMLGSLYR